MATLRIDESMLRPVSNIKLSKESEELLARMRNAGRLAGLQSDDPLMPLLVALTSAMRHILARTTASDRIVSRSSKCIADAVMINRSAVDAAVDRLKRELAVSEKSIAGHVTDLLLADLPASFIDRTARARRWRRVRYLIVMMIGILAGTLFVPLTAKLPSQYEETRKGALATVVLRDGSDVAAAWEQLMLWNDLRSALADCDKRGSMQDGRRYCRFEMWIEGLSQQSSPR